MTSHTITGIFPAGYNVTVATLFNQGTISGPLLSNGIGLYSANSADIINSGKIAPGSLHPAVSLHAGGTLTNAIGGTIAGSNGVSISGGGATVVNAGSITAAATNGVGVYLAGTSVGYITNAASGSIAGAVGIDLLAGGTLTNAGTISGSGGTAVAFGGTGSNLLVLDPDARFSGMVVGNASARNELELASASGVGTLNGFGVSFVNFGTISVDAGASWYLNKSSPTGIGKIVLIDGTLTNSGTMQSGVTLNTGAVFANKRGGFIAPVPVYGSSTIPPVYTAVGGVVLSVTWNGIKTFAAGTVINEGRIAGRGAGCGIFLGGGVVINAASASISGGNVGVALQRVGTVTNAASASISGGQYGVALLNGGIVSNAASGLITSAWKPIVSYGPGTVVNDGTIVGYRADDSAILLSGGGSVTNGASGVIASRAFGVHVSRGAGTVANAGTIAGTGRMGIGITFAGIGVDLESGGTLTNAGTIIGNGGGTLTNGKWVDYADTAVSFGGIGSNRLVLDPGAVFLGGVAGSASASNTLELASGSSAGTLTADGSFFTNLASATIDSGAAWKLTDVTLLDAGELANDGQIVLNSSALLAASLTGTGSITIDAGATLIVQGTISAGETIVFDGVGGVLDLGDTAAMGGTIMGYVSGDAINHGPQTLTNHGTITGAGHYGVFLDFGGLVTNAAAASITGNYTGIQMRGRAGTVVNHGSIAGTARYGVDLKSGGSVTNAASASITGGSDGVKLEGGGSVTNAVSALITGGKAGVVLASGGTLTNAGTIVGNGGTAVSFGGTGPGLLVLDPGYKFSGIVTGSASASDTLELASAASAGVLTGLGTEFVDFGSIVLDARARWAVAGTVTAGQIVDFAGTSDLLTLSNPDAMSGTIEGFNSSDTIALAGIADVTSTTMDANNLLTVTQSVGAPITLQFDPSQDFSAEAFRHTLSGSMTDITLAATRTEHWVGGSGNFNTATHWNPQYIPDATNIAIIDAPGTYTVTASTDETVDTLAVAANAKLVVSAGTFTVSDGSAAGGLAGTIVVAAGAVLALEGAAVNTGTIAGAGQLGNGASLSLVNAAGAIINANQASALALNATGEVSNAGLVEATNTAVGNGGLVVQSTTIDNAGGTVAANGAHTHVDLAGGTIIGGVLATSGGGVIQTAAGANAVLDGLHDGALTNNGLVRVTDSTSLDLLGSIVNTGTINANATTAGNTDLQIGSPVVTLSGGGTVLLSGNAGNRIVGTAAANRLVNSDNTIAGGGQLGAGALAFSNGGTVNANAAVGLTIDLGSQAGQNLAGGLIEATDTAVGNGGLVVQSTTIDNAGGTVAANGAHTHVDLAGGTLIGGVLATSGGGVIRTAAGANGVLDGLHDGALTNNGLVRVTDGTSLDLLGSIVNTGTINANATTAGNTDLQIGSPVVTLSGAGTVLLSGNAGNRIVGTAAANRLVNSDNTIAGGGQLGAGALAFSNSGTVNANAAAGLTIDLGSQAGQNLAGGLIEATGAGGLTIASGTISNAGTMLAANGSKLTFQSGVVNSNNTGGVLSWGTFKWINGLVVGGGTWEADGNGSTLSVTGGAVTMDRAAIVLSGPGSVFRAGDGSSFTKLEASLGNVAPIGVLELLAGRSFTATHGIADHGMIQLAGGTLTLPRLAVAASGIVRGFGTIADTRLPIFNGGTIEAQGGTLAIATAVDPASNGVFQLDASSLLEIAADHGAGGRMSFLGTGGELIIDAAQKFGLNVGSSAYTGPLVQNFATGDAILLKNVAPAGLTPVYDTATGILQLSNGSANGASLMFDKTTLGAGTFHIGDDGQGRALLTHS